MNTSNCAQERIGTGVSTRRKSVKRSTGWGSNLPPYGTITPNTFSNSILFMMSLFLSQPSHNKQESTCVGRRHLLGFPRSSSQSFRSRLLARPKRKQSFDPLRLKSVRSFCCRASRQYNVAISDGLNHTSHQISTSVGRTESNAVAEAGSLRRDQHVNSFAPICSLCITVCFIFNQANCA